ncbi:MAG: ATP-binding protein [Bacteroidetes bacterium]|nr:ATP-binding protein [Bacteroidota bacterium]
MKRSAYNQLLEWKNDKDRKPLVIQGARQVGKTYLVNEFGRKGYKNYIYLNFEQDSNLESIFNHSLNPLEIVENIGLYLGQKITSDETLVFFDEIQVSPRVLSSLKYFQEQTPEFHIIAAGSLLGVSIGKESGFPVGKVNFMTIYPMSFNEYLIAMGEDLLVDKLEKIKSPDPLAEAIHQKLMNYFKMYLYLGGMPEVIQNYINEQDIVKARRIQNDILQSYHRDFSKYADKKQAIKISEFWHSIPRQLAKENKKFKYGEIKKNARASMFDQTVEWLSKAGLITVVYNVPTPKMPLSAFADYSKFKIFFHDVGLLAAELNVSSELILLENRIISEFKGAFIENFVAQELKSYGNNSLFYWTSKSEAEIDFIISDSAKIYPLEVKSGMNRNIKSLRSYADKYSPDRIFRLSPRNLIQSDDFINIPLYACKLLKNFI